MIFQGSSALGVSSVLSLTVEFIVGATPIPDSLDSKIAHRGCQITF